MGAEYLIIQSGRRSRRNLYGGGSPGGGDPYSSAAGIVLFISIILAALILIMLMVASADTDTYASECYRYTEDDKAVVVSIHSSGRYATVRLDNGSRIRVDMTEIEDIPCEHRDSGDPNP